VSVNAPQLTSNPPQLHHKNTTLKAHFFAKPLQKRHSTTQEKIS